MNDIIDVEVSEEENEQLSLDNFSDDEIDGMVRQLKSLIINSNYMHTSEIEQLAYKIAINSKEYLDNETYMWVMYAYSLKYDLTNPKAKIFTLLRIRNLIEGMNNKTRKARALNYHDFKIDENIKRDAFENTKFINKVISKARIQFLSMEAVLAIAFVLIAIYLINLNLASAIGIGIAVVLCNYFLSFANVKKNFINNELYKYRNAVKDEELLKFDLPVFNSQI